MSIGIDKSDMHDVLEKFQDQCEEAYKLVGEKSINADVDSIIIVGMGGSALAGHLLKTYYNDAKIPIRISRNYELPIDTKITEKTLVIAISYSGNTEETISAYREAIKKKAKVLAMSSGGKLQELSKLNENEYIKVPSGMQPRLGMAYLFFPLVKTLTNSGILPDRTNEIEKGIERLRPETFIENAKHLAKNLVGKTPIIYTTSKLEVVGYRWKCDINENSKMHAFNNVYPEFNHNELNGYKKSPGDFYIIQILDEDDHPRNKKRMEIVKDLIKQQGISVTTLALKGNRLHKLLSGIYLGEWTSYFLALNNEIDPTEVKMIEGLKEALKN